MTLSSPFERLFIKRAIQNLLSLASIAILLTCAAVVASAQDAGQVLRLSVGYNTLRNSTELSPEVRAEVDRLGKLAQEANAGRKYGEALKHYYRAMSLMRGDQWTPARELAAATTIKLDRAIVRPSQRFRVSLGQIFALDQKINNRYTAQILLQARPGNDRVAMLKTVENVEPDFHTTPVSFEISAPDVADGAYTVVVSLNPNGSSIADDVVTKNAPIRIERALEAEFNVLKVRAARVAEKLKTDRRENLINALATTEYRIALFDRANASLINPERVKFKDEIASAMAELAALESGRDPFATTRGDFRKAYRSNVDNSLQPYRIYVPTNYDASKSWPLIVALHGMGGDENSYFDQYRQGAFKVEAEKRGYLVVCPKGREPASMYLGNAEKDVIDALAEVRRSYRIDPDRIYMTGHSMGGYGTWSVAMNHPDIFAALAPVAGGGQPGRMARIAHIPQLVVHGDNDKTVPVERSRVMVEAAKKLTVEIKYIEIPNGDHISVALRSFSDVFDWFDSHRRKNTNGR
jgi:predicted esterase